MCWLFLGQAAPVTWPLTALRSVSSLIHMEQGQHCWPELAQATEGSFTHLIYCMLLSMSACIYVLLCYCMCVYRYVCLWSIRLRRILRVAGPPYHMRPLKVLKEQQWGKLHHTNSRARNSCTAHLSVLFNENDFKISVKSCRDALCCSNRCRSLYP